MNKHGLSRYIPERVKRGVRQRNGFGCIMCGKAIFEYDHLSPEFDDATEHNADGIVLLCGEHHTKKTKGMLSVETITAAALNPKARQQGFSFEAFDIGIEPPEIVLGTLVAKNARVIIQLYGEDVLSILPPECEGAPFRINACLTDRDGNTIFEIHENEWRTPCENWDVEITGSRITIRKRLGDILMQIRSDPPHRLVFEQLDMVHRGARIFLQKEKQFEFTSPDGTRLSVGSVNVDRCDVVVCISTTGIALGMNQPRMRRNEACYCNSGLRFKKCCGQILDKP